MSRSTTTSATAPQTSKGVQTQTQVTAKPAMAQSCAMQEKVAARAYQKWLQKGCKHGHDKQDWAEAEAELKAEQARAAKK